MSWTTRDELTFIDNLGTHCFNGSLASSHSLPLTRLIELVTGYLVGCSKRRTWGNIEKSVAIAHAESRLHALRIALAQEQRSKRAESSE